MEDKTIKILLIEDNPDDAELLERKLAKPDNAKFAVTSATTLKEGLRLLAQEGTDLVLTDLGLPDSHGLDTITRVLYQSKYTPVVVLSGLDDEELAIRAVHLGAQDYVVKGQVEGRQLERAILYAVQRSRLQKELERYTQELSKSRDNLRKILEKNADAIIVVSQGRHIRFITPAAESLLRRRKKELLCKPFGFPLEAGKTSEIEIIHPGGEVTIAEMRVVDIDWEGRPAYLASLRDITGRKKAEEALRFSDAAFRSINESVIATDLDYTITRWNEISERIYGVSASEAMGHKLLDVIEIAESYPGENTARFAKLEANGSYQEEQLHRTRYGEVWVDVHMQAIEDKGMRYGWVILATAITQRKHAEEALRQSEEFASSLLQNAPNPIVVINPDTSIKYASPAFEKLTGFSSDEVVGIKEPYPWWPEQEERSHALQEAMAGRSYRIERTNRKKNGEIIWAVLNSAPVMSQGTLKYLLVNWVDITELKQAEEKLRRIDKMKSEFLSNISHELRTPLQSIGGFAKLLLRGQVPDKKNQQEFLEIIDQESQYLANLIDSLLDMSRLESGRFEINKRLGPVRDTIVDAVRIFKGLARDKEITLVEEIAEKLPELEVDSGRLRQVVINLVGNAIKFSDPGASVMVKTECRDRELVFQVADRGIGISEESMKHLFERFYRAEDQMVKGGAGLGLYISKQIIEAHGGRIWAESKMGEGSTFSFALPINSKGGGTHG